VRDEIITKGRDMKVDRRFQIKKPNLSPLSLSETSSSEQSSSGQSSSEHGSARLALVFAMLFVIALAALAAPQSPGQYPGRRGPGGPEFVSRDRIPYDFGGGNGGRPSQDALCEPNAVAVGFHIQTGEFINEAWLDCSWVRPDGRVTDDRRVTGRTGSPGGRPVSDAYCRRGMVLRGLRGNTAASVDTIAGMCSPLEDIASRNPRPRTQITRPVMRPRPGGRPVQVECAPGQAVTGFRSNSGEYMDHLWILCSEVRPMR
jgi:hypothetical protein